MLSLFGREAFRALSRNTLRGALSVLGITIGIAAVVCVVAIGAAGSERAEQQLQNLGDNLVVGVFFGFYPAWKAAQLDPIAALRHE